MFDLDLYKSTFFFLIHNFPFSHFPFLILMNYITSSQKKSNSEAIREVLICYYFDGFQIVAVSLNGQIFLPNFWLLILA